MDQHNHLTQQILNAAFEVHTLLGPGLLEKSYELALHHELDLRHIPHQRQLTLAARYKTISLEDSYRIDLLIDQQIVIEIKSVESVLPIHRAQLLTYLKLGNYPLGLLLNFNTPRLKEGIHRIINSKKQPNPPS